MASVERCVAIVRAKKKIGDDRDELSTDPQHDIASRMRLNRYESAIRCWVDALNARGSRALVEAAVHPEVRVLRYGFGENLGHLVQTIQGTSGVAEWFGLSPKTIEFELSGPVELETDITPESQRQGATSRSEQSGDDGGVARVRYTVGAVGFSNSGTWRFGLSDDDRIAWIEHHPDDLANPVQERRSRTGENREHHHDDPHHVEHTH